MMTSKRFAVYILLISFLGIAACGGLRFHQLAPEAKDFHPKNIAVFPIEVWNHKDIDSRTVVEQIVSGLLVEKKWFDHVMDAQSLQSKINADDELRDATRNFFDKLRMLNYADPGLSREIGRIAGIDAYLLVFVDEWKYTAEGDKKTAHVGLTMELYDVVTGRLMWKGNHIISSDYVIIKPELSRIARDVARKMIHYMPH